MTIYFFGPFFAASFLAGVSPAIHCVKLLSIPAVFLEPSNNYRELSPNYDQGDLLKITVTHVRITPITFKKFSIKMARVETVAVLKLTSRKLTSHNKVKIAVKNIIQSN